MSLTADPTPATTGHYPLEDGPGNDWSTFAGAVDAVRTALCEDRSVLVHCTAGISRSSAVTAAAIAAEERRAFREALAIVQDHRVHAVHHPALHRLGVTYFAALG